jgi:hypothetical protein
LLANDGKFCDCPLHKHILTNAHCRLNVIVATNKAFDFVYVEPLNPVVKDLKEEDEEFPFKKELLSCIEEDCGAEPFEPFPSKEEMALAKKLHELADFSNPFHTDDPCPTPLLKAHNKTDLPTPLLGCSEKLDEILSPQDDALPKQQVQVCAVQVMVTAQGGTMNQQSSQQESSRQNTEEPRVQRIICAPVSRDPRTSRTSLGEIN